MRILFTSTAPPGHLNPILGFALAAQEAGHEVLVATAAPMRPRLDALGLPLYPAGITPDHPDVVAVIQSGVTSTPKGADALFGTMASAAYEGVEGAMTSFEPELVLSDAFEMAGPPLAERIGARRAIFGLAGTEPVDRFGEALGGGFASMRSRAGLDGDALEGILTADWIFGGLPAFAPEGARIPARVHYVRPHSETRNALDDPPAWAAELAGRRSVYFTLGTAMAAMRPGFMETVLAGLAAAELDAVVATTGPHREPTNLADLPSSFRVERYVPQSFVLPHVSAAVLHAGYGSMSAAMAHGLPLVLVPFGADQPANAACAVRLGTAVQLDKTTMTPESVRDAVLEVLGDPGYAERARAVGAELRGLPTPGEIIARLTS